MTRTGGRWESPPRPAGASPFFYAASGAAVAIVAASMAGFSIVRLRPKFNFLLFLIIYRGTFLPFQMYLIPVYRLFNPWACTTLAQA